MSDSSNSSSGCGCTIFAIPATLVAMIGFHIHGSYFWSVIDFIFWPFTLLKWIIWHEVTLTIIKETFSWFFK